MGKGYFITGTDTGVGKTLITASLATILRQQNYTVGVMKPVETGCQHSPGEEPYPEDALFLQKASACSAPLEIIAPYQFAEPLAPAIAAERAGRPINFEHIRACYQQLLATHDVVLVEGAGGLLVPLTDELTMQDIAIELDLPLLIVARNVLGMINHTALTVTVAQQRCSVLGLVINQTEPPDPGDVARHTNEQALKRWGRAEVFGQIPYLPAVSPAALLTTGELLATNGLLHALGLSGLYVPAGKS